MNEHLNLKLIEVAMDKANGNYGNEVELCIYCKSMIYDGKQGIKHNLTCPITLIRKLIIDVGKQASTPKNHTQTNKY